MKYSTRLSDAVHILAFIALYPNCDLTSNKLAESIQTNPAYVRQLMSALRKGGLLVSVKGHPRPALAREPEKITLLDAYRAVEGNKPLRILFHTLLLHSYKWNHHRNKSRLRSAD